MTSYCRERLEFTAHQRPTVGDTKMSVIPNDHLGWLKCDGRFMSKDEFYLLFRVIGYSFTASPDGDTFQLPNAAGRVPGVIGTGTDANLSTFSIALGDSIGEYNHTLTIAEMPSHNHGVAGGSNAHNNIQPTIGLGNMFIYSGRTFYPLNGFPYTDGTLIL